MKGLKQFQKFDLEEFLKGKEKNGKIMSKDYVVKAIILWDVNMF